jgi:hypothetical protein
MIENPADPRGKEFLFLKYLGFAFKTDGESRISCQSRGKGRFHLTK